MNKKIGNKIAAETAAADSRELLAQAETRLRHRVFATLDKAEARGANAVDIAICNIEGEYLDGGAGSRPLHRGEQGWLRRVRSIIVEWKMTEEAR